MSTQVDIPALERPAFFDGQRLTAADLAAVQSVHRELHWLHNRSLHAWGIVFGLHVTGQRGDRVVTIHPGYALDSLGRELLLSQTGHAVDDQGRELTLSQALALAVPAVAGAKSGDPATYYLTISYMADEDLPAAETRAGTCQGRGAVRRPEAPRLRWLDPNEQTPEGRYRHGLDVVLATAQVQNCRLTAPVSLAERREARPAQQPYVAAGATAAGDTPWDLWVDAGATLGVQTTVDTSAAGFGTTPHYTAHVAGSRFRFDAEDKRYLSVDGFARISDPTPTGFVLQVLLPRNLSLLGSYTLNPSDVFSRLTDKIQTLLQWHVVWMGVEG